MAIQNNFPNIRPSLALDFANTKTLDPRITFSRASSATYFDANGVLQTAPSGVARFDHDPVTGASLGLLIEEAQTNRCLYSEDFSNGAWVPTNITVTANSVAAPDGNTNADTLTATAANGTLIQNLGVVASAAKTGSLYIKRKTGTGNIDLTMDGGSTWTTKTVTSAWTRIDITQTLADEDFGIRIATSGDEVDVWGGTVETGAFPTSYIKTEGAQATRNADAASMTGANFSSWYRQDQGTVYSEWSSVGSLSDSRIVYSISDNTFNNSLHVLAAVAGAANQTQLVVRAVGATSATLTIAGAYTNYAFRKTAMGYQVDNFAASADGSTPAGGAVDTLGPVMSGVNRMYIGASWVGTSNFINGHIRKIAYYPARLTNANLQAITA